MSLLLERLPSLIIANGGTDSPALSTLLSAGQMKVLFNSLSSMLIAVPAVLTGACTVQVVLAEGGSGWQTLQYNNTDISLGAGKVNTVLATGMIDMRIHSASAEGATRTFGLSAQVFVD